MDNSLKYKGYRGSVEWSKADSIYYGKVVGVNSLISYQGDTIQSLRDDFQGAIDDYLEMCAEKGVELKKTQDFCGSNI